MTFKLKVDQALSAHSVNRIIIVRGFSAPYYVVVERDPIMGGCQGDTLEDAFDCAIASLTARDIAKRREQETDVNKPPAPPVVDDSKPPPDTIVKPPA